MENDIIVSPLVQAKKRNYKIYLYIATLCLVIIGGVILILTTFVLPYDDNIIEVIGYDDIRNSIPVDTKKSFSTQLYNQLKINFEVSYRRGAVKAVIRPETYNENANITTTGSFIVDIDEYQQTFQVDLTWSSSGAFIPENVVLNCTKKSLAKYPDAICYGMYNTSDSVSLYLPYETTLSSGERMTLQYDYTDSDGVQNLKILVENCGDQNVKTVALDVAKKYIDSLGITKASDYKYNVPSIYNNCVVK